jgi:hypothetical protein
MSIPKLEMASMAQFVRDNLLWVVGTVPLVIAAFNILSISNGDPQVFAYLIQGLSVVQLVLGVILPLIPPAIIWLSIAFFVEQRALPKDERFNVFNQYHFAVMAIGVVAIFALRISWLISTLVLLIYVLMYHLWANWRNKKNRVRDGADAERVSIRPLNFQFVIALIVVTVVQAIASSRSGWIPYELIDVKDHPAISGQVLSSDGSWTKFLDRKHSIQIVSTANLISRQPCYVDSSYLDETVGLAITRLITNMPVTQCPKS